jgi:hypothetical protein
MPDRLDDLLKSQAQAIYMATRDALQDQWASLSESDKTAIQRVSERLVALEYQSQSGQVDDAEVLAVAATLKNWSAISSIRSAIVVQAFAEAVAEAGKKMGSALIKVGLKVLESVVH